MALCTGCQKFRDRVFSSELVAESGEEFAIHRNYAELSSCADSCCEMCRYLRREIWFDSGYDLDSFRHCFQDTDYGIALQLLRAVPVRPEPLHWELKFGEDCTSSVRLFKYGSRKVAEIPGASQMPEHIQDMGREWLTTCRTKHKHCEPTDDDGKRFLPTRLLDLGCLDPRYIRLVHPDKTQEMRYATLSYCWGDAKNAACTTKANLAERLAAILVESLPQTIQDAVEVTRSLGVRYLWVDALCIMQVAGKVNHDWKRELNNMGKIYKHSLFTIAASGAKSSSVGLYSRIEPACWPVQDYYLSRESHSLDEDSGLIMEATLPHWSTAVECSALSRRGWVLQERMSASRSLFFTERGVFWECSEIKTSEYGPVSPDVRFSYPTLQELADDIKSHDFYQTRTGWKRLVERFTSKSLTVATDRLAAITGLATSLARLSGRRYSTGVFEHNLKRELTWYISENPELPGMRLPGIPSWSWASSNLAVFFREYLFIKNVELGATELSMSERQIRVYACLGNLVVTKSTVIETASCYTHPQIFSSPLYTIKSGTSNNRIHIRFDTYLDALPEEGGSILCIHWFEENLDCWEIEYHKKTGAMVIAPVDEEESTYRRIGWADIDDGGGLFEQEPRNIILV